MSHFLTYVLGNELEDEDQERIRQSTISNMKAVIKKEGGLTPKSTKSFYENWLYTIEEKLQMILTSQLISRSTVV